MFYTIKETVEALKSGETTSEDLVRSSIDTFEKDKKSDIQVSKELYINRCEIGYELPDNTKYEERGV